MLKLLVSAPTYKVVNDIMWDVIIHCNKSQIPLKKINWAEIIIKTKNCKIEFCLDKEFKKLLKRRLFDMSFTSEQVNDLLRYISESDKWLKCDLKGRRVFK